MRIFRMLRDQLVADGFGLVLSAERHQQFAFQLHQVRMVRQLGLEPHQCIERRVLLTGLVKLLDPLDLRPIRAAAKLEFLAAPTGTRSIGIDGHERN